MSGDSSLYSIAVLIDELKAEESGKRSNALKNLCTVAQAIGHERTRQELIPYLTELMDDDDQVLIQMADTLSQFIPYIGGKSYAHLLLEPLEQLCHIEETSVRNSSISALKKIFKSAPETAQNQGFQFIQKTFHEQWYTSKVTASNLIPTTFELVNSQKQMELIEILLSLSKDINPQVRRAAAVSLNELISFLNQENQTQFGKILEILCNDEQDSVRLLAAETSIEMGKKLKLQKSSVSLMPQVNQLIEDKS